MRENYQANHTTDDKKLGCLYRDYTLDGAYHACDSEAKLSHFTPQGWRVSSKTDFLNIQKTLNANDVTHISTAKAFFPDASGGVLGFWHKFNGYSNGTTFYDGGWNGYYGCLKKDANTYDGVFKISSNELFEAPADYAWGETQRFTVRLVQDIY